MKIKRNITLLLLACLIANIFTGCAEYESNSAYIQEANALETDTQENERVYECDYHTLSINTYITTVINDEKVKITGNIFKLFTDPLTMRDSNENIIGYAYDSYCLIGQDAHDIYVNNKCEIIVDGQIDLFGETYILYDVDGNEVGRSEFNMFDNYGKIVDNDGNTIAIYESSMLLNDFVVTIYDNNICSDEAILMIISSYVSDVKADSKSRSSSSKN